MAYWYTGICIVPTTDQGNGGVNIINVNDVVELKNNTCDNPFPAGERFLILKIIDTFFGEICTAECFSSGEIITAYTHSFTSVYE